MKNVRGRVKSYDIVSMETFCHTDMFHPFERLFMTISKMLKKCGATEINYFCMNIAMKYRDIYYLVRRLRKNKKRD